MGVFYAHSFKQTARKEWSKKVSPPALALPPLKSEKLSENRLQKKVYLKVNNTAIGSQGNKKISRISELTGYQPVLHFHLKYKEVVSIFDVLLSI